MSLDRDSLVPAQLRWLDPLASIRSPEATLRTRHACPLVAPERNGPDRYTHRPDIRRPPAREFLPVASGWRNWRRNVRKNQSADEREIVPGRSSVFAWRQRIAKTCVWKNWSALFTMARGVEILRRPGLCQLAHSRTNPCRNLERFRRSLLSILFPADSEDETTSYRRAFRIV